MASTGTIKTSRQLLCLLLIIFVALSTIPMNMYLFTFFARDDILSEVMLTYKDGKITSRKSIADLKQTAPTHCNSTSIDIFWLHIPKTGTSLFNTIYLHFCPSILVKHPSLLKNETPLMDSILLKDYPPKKYCNSTIRNMENTGCAGCHHPYGKGVKPRGAGWETPSSSRKALEKGADPYYFTMFRDPMMRVKSAYSYGKHYSRLKDDSISFDTYVSEKHIPNCQLKMMLGFECNEYKDPRSLNVTLAIERIQSPKFFFEDTDQWDKSICLFHKWFGGTVQPFELRNNRKTKRVDDSEFANYTFAETSFYIEAMKIFDDRIKEAGC